MTLKIAGLIWYRMEQYDAAMAIMEDRGKLHRTYTEWRLAAEKAEKQARRAGWTTTRAYLDPAEFVSWCRERGLNVDAEARKRFANTVAAQAAQDAH